MALGRTERASFALSVLGHLLVLVALAWLGTGGVKGSGGSIMVALVEGRGGGHEAEIAEVRSEAPRPSPAPVLEPVRTEEEPAPVPDMVIDVSLNEADRPDQPDQRASLPAAGPPGAPGPALYGAEEGRVAGIILGIRETIQGAVLYPPVARRRGYEGTVIASFAVDMGGMPRDIKLVESSGHGVLDKEVLRVIEHASPYPSVPEEVEVPVTFRLR
jgi:protein TonB